MKFVVSISLICILVLTSTPYTSSAPSAILPYSYAFAHPYFTHPYYITYPNHHSEHKEDDEKDDGRKDETKNVVENLSAPITYQVLRPLAYPIVSQFHAQDNLGQYHYGYASPLSSKDELKTFDGVTRGGYSYVDSNGELQSVAYVADALGFRVAATNLPIGVKAVDIPDSPVIAEEKRKLFALQKKAAEEAAQTPE